MSDVTLTAGIRQNLLSLQQTSAELTQTQEALSTGNAVNSAAENPSAYFTSQNLTNTANSLSALLDQIGQGLQTIDAADNGLTGITSLLQQALSTVQQAQSDSWTTAAAATGTAVLANSTTTGSLDLTSTTAASTGTVNLNASTLTGVAAVSATLSAGSFTIDAGGSDYVVSIAASATASQVAADIGTATGNAVTATVNGSGDLVLTSTTGSFTVDDNATAEAVGLTTSGNNAASTFTNPTSGGTLTIAQGTSSPYSIAITANEGLSAIESAINSATGGAVTATANSSGDLVLTSATGGYTVGGSAATAVGLTAGSVTAALDNAATAGTLNIVAGGSSYSVTITAGEAASSVAAAIGTATGGAVTAAVNGSGDLVLSSNNASGFTVDDSATAESLGLTTVGNNTTVTPAANSLSGGNLLIAVGSTTFSVSVAANSSLAQIEADINGTSGLGSSGAVTASDDGDGHLVLTSNSAPTGFTVVANAFSTALGLTTNATTNNAPIGSSTTRATLQENYNGLLSQINEMASDSGYNGVNLLGGDNLTIDFNQTGTSQLVIQGVNYNAQGLGLSSITGSAAGSFEDNGALSNLVSSINTAISNVQSQTETFGTNSSTISTRQTFTTAMINTLQTGASNLVVADQNQESADLLTEQTQQQLEISALSIANQANQSVLKLFS